MFRMKWGLSVAGLLVLSGIVNAADVVNHRVGQKNKTFSVSTLSIALGDKVTFNNDDDTVHNVYSADKRANFFNLKAQAPGTSSSIVFDKAGVYEIRCAIHPQMKLLITVNP